MAPAAKRSAGWIRRRTAGGVVPTNEELTAAIRGCPRDRVTELLSNYYELVEATFDGMPAIIYACFIGRQDVAEAIKTHRSVLNVFEAAALGDTIALSASLDVNPGNVDAVASDGSRPLGIASFFGREEAVRVLLARGAHPGGTSQDSLRATPLHTAAARHHLGIAQALLDHGAPIDARQQGGFTPLMIAALQNQKPIVELLLARGADPTLRDEFGRSAEDYARDVGFSLMAPRLVL